jgi:hypothetical protein
MIGSYYFLSGKDEKQDAIALAPEGTKLSHHLISDLDGKNVDDGVSCNSS